MLVQIEDLARPSQNTRQRYVGIVVDNQDPDKLGRIKVKVPNMIETASDDRLPWVYPYRPASTGGSPSSGSHAVPEKFSQVYVTFPTGDPYSAFYESAPLNKGTVQLPSQSNSVPEAPKNELPSSEVDPKKSDSTSIVTIPFETLRGDPIWVRVDRNQGKVEFYMGEPKLYFHFDRGGNVQLKTPGNLDFDIGGKMSLKVGKEITVKGETQFTIDVGKDATIKTAKKLMLDVGSDMSMKVSGNRGATVLGDDDTAVSGSRRAVIGSIEAVKTKKSYFEVESTATFNAGSTINLKSGVVNIYGSNMLQLGGKTVSSNSGGGAASATSAAVAAMQAYFIASAATGLNKSAKASSESSPISALFPPGTNLSLSLSQQSSSVQANIEDSFQSHIFNGTAVTQLFSTSLPQVFGNIPLSQLAHVTDIQDLISALPSSTITQFISPSILNGLSPQQIFSGDLKSILSTLTSNQLLSLDSLSTLFGHIDPNSLLGQIAPQLLNGFSLGGLNFEFIGRKIISEFMNKFAAHLSALAMLTGRVQLMSNKLDTLNQQSQSVQTASQEFSKKMEERSQKLVGEDF